MVEHLLSTVLADVCSPRSGACFGDGCGRSQSFPFVGTIFVPAGHFMHSQCTTFHCELEGNNKKNIPFQPVGECRWEEEIGALGRKMSLGGQKMKNLQCGQQEEWDERRR